MLVQNKSVILKFCIVDHYSETQRAMEDAPVSKQQSYREINDIEIRGTTHVIEFGRACKSTI